MSRIYISKLAALFLIFTGPTSVAIADDYSGIVKDSMYRFVYLDSTRLYSFIGGIYYPDTLKVESVSTIDDGGPVTEIHASFMSYYAGDIMTDHGVGYFKSDFGVFIRNGVAYCAVAYRLASDNTLANCKRAPNNDIQSPDVSSSYRRSIRYINGLACMHWKTDGARYNGWHYETSTGMWGETHSAAVQNRDVITRQYVNTCKYRVGVGGSWVGPNRTVTLEDNKLLNTVQIELDD